MADELLDTLPSSGLPVRTVGKFRLERRLGFGAMGEVFLGVHVTLGSCVAIKLLNAAAAAERNGVERFLNEARAVAAIGHENIAAVIDQDVLPDGTPYIVMEYVEGTTLRDVLTERGALPLRLAVGLAVDALAALAAAHAKGIVHRDLKPENIRVTPTQRAKVLDFGVAKFLHRPVPLLTTQGAIIGTPHYMSPEQVAAAEIDGRADVYAMGVVLFECSTGQRPFDGENMVQLLQRQLHAAPPRPAGLRPDLPPALEEVILKALEKDPARRFDSAEQMGAALRALLPTLPETQFVQGTAAPRLTATPVGSLAEGPSATPLGRAAPVADDAALVQPPVSAGEVRTKGERAAPTQRVRPPNRATAGLVAAAVLGAAAIGAWRLSEEARLSNTAAGADGARANVGGANVGGANVGGANVGGANVGGANVGGANVGGANVGGANVGGANPAPRGPTRTGVPTATQRRVPSAAAAVSTPPPSGVTAIAEPARTTSASVSAAGGAEIKIDGTTPHLEIPNPAAQPRTHPIDFEPKNFDVLGYLPRALALAHERMSDAVLTNLEVSGVFPDGHADLTLSRSYEAAYYFRSPSRSRADPRVPEDDQDLPCLTYVIVTARSVETTVPPSMRGCREKPLPPRACTLAQVMARAKAEGASAEKVAKVTHLADGSWVVDQGNGPKETFYLGCP